MAWKARGSLSFTFDQGIVPVMSEAVPISLSDRAAHVQKNKKAPFGAFFNVAEREGLAHILRAAVRLACRTLRIPPRAKQLARSSPPTQKPLTGLLCFGGEGGIRTLDTAKPCAGFRVRCNRPLYHLSVIGRNEAAIIAVRRTLGRCMRNASGGCISASVSPMEGFNY